MVTYYGHCASTKRHPLEPLERIDAPPELRYRNAFKHVFILEHVRDDLWGVKRSNNAWYWTADPKAATPITFEEACELAPAIRGTDARFSPVGVLIPLEDDDET